MATKSEFSIGRVKGKYVVLNSRSEPVVILHGLSVVWVSLGGEYGVGSLLEAISSLKLGVELRSPYLMPFLASIRSCDPSNISVLDSRFEVRISFDLPPLTKSDQCERAMSESFEELRDLLKRNGPSLFVDETLYIQFKIGAAS